MATKMHMADLCRKLGSDHWQPFRDLLTGADTDDKLLLQLLLEHVDYSTSTRIVEAYHATARSRTEQELAARDFDQSQFVEWLIRQPDIEEQHLQHQLIDTLFEVRHSDSSIECRQTHGKGTTTTLMHFVRWMMGRETIAVITQERELWEQEVPGCLAITWRSASATLHGRRPVPTLLIVDDPLNDAERNDVARNQLYQHLNRIGVPYVYASTDWPQ